MQVAFMSESNHRGKYPRDFLNARTDVAWMAALNADHYQIGRDLDKLYDLGILIIPKKHIDRLSQYDILAPLKAKCKHVAVMQEGPHWYFQDFTLDEQIWYYNTLLEVDFMFVHNEIDRKYYSGLIQKPCYTFPSLMIEDTITADQLPVIDKRHHVIIGGNFCHWYGGFDSYVVAQEFDCDIYAPSMGRRIEGEEQMPGLTHLPYMGWTSWIKTLSQFRYGVHMMRTHAAGTFALNCAYLGIPCIGYAGLDTQEICHPDLTVKIGDIVAAKELARCLKTSTAFYDECSSRAKSMYKDHFSEEKFVKKITDIVNAS